MDSAGIRITNTEGLVAIAIDRPYRTADIPPPEREPESEHEGFRVRGPDADAGYWTVDLPHQCDEWEVASSTDPAEAVAEMEQFVSDAQAALEELRRRVAEDPGAASSVS